MSQVVAIGRLKKTQRRFAAVLSWGFLIAPCGGYALAVLFGLASWDAPENNIAAFDVVALISLLYALGAAFYFYNYLQPINDWLMERQPETETPPWVHERLQKFSYYYWMFHLGYILISPFPYFGIGLFDVSGIESLATPFLFLTLQFAASALLGLPSYLLGLNLLGSMVSFVGLEKVQVSLRHRLLIIVGLVPLLTSAILAQYYWYRTEFVSFETLLVWAGLGAFTFFVATVSIQGMSQSLRPVREILEGSAQTERAEYAKHLKPHSVDEIGSLTQMLGQLFARLDDQDEQVRAIVDNAAEGIIVVDGKCVITTFNRAAENLFGYDDREVLGQSLAWLLPSLMDESGCIACELEQAHEVNGVHNSGRHIDLAVRISQMEISGQTMYTCLVADISEKKAAAKKAAQAESRYRHLVETAHDLVWSMDLQARWSYLNKAAKSIYGYEPEEMIGRYVRDFQLDEYSEQDMIAFTEMLKGKELVQHETAHVDVNGTVHYLSFNARAYRDADGNVLGVSGTARDITEQKAVERQLAYQAQHDALTGLANRRQFQQELERVVARVARSGASCALLYIDLDQFKYINDTLGHAAGDRLLIEFSALLKSHLREGDLLSRFGGDEFTVLLYNVDEAAAVKVADNLRLTVERYRFLEQGNVYNVSCSLGVSLIDNTTQSVDECMAHADLACHLAKTSGRNRSHLYQPDDHSKAGMEADMGRASRVKETLENDRMQVVYQPIASVSDGSVQDYEVLVRMRCDDGKIIMPGGFMPAAERFGLIHSVDRWMVTTAMRKLATLREAGQQVNFSINLSARAFDDDRLLPLIRELLQETQMMAQALTFELTETAAIGNLSKAVDFITELKDMGCMFALDDFGSGFSSFTYLKHLPVDKLKIDGAFVQNLAQSSVDQAMVRSMNQVAHALGKVTIAEFVENEQTLALLQEFGVNYAQGYYIGKPMDDLAGLENNLSAGMMPPAAMVQ